MVGWHHRFNEHGFGWTLGVGDGQGGLEHCGSWGHKESDTTERLNWIEFMINFINSRVYLKTTLWFYFVDAEFTVCSLRFLVLSFRSCISLLIFFRLFDFSKVERSMLKSLTMMVDLLLYPCSSNKINFICFKAILLVTIYLELLHLFGELNSELNYLSLVIYFIYFICY